VKLFPTPSGSIGAKARTPWLLPPFDKLLSAQAPAPTTTTQPPNHRWFPGLRVRSLRAR
jgi:hypothetical protein